MGCTLWLILGCIWQERVGLNIHYLVGFALNLLGLTVVELLLWSACVTLVLSSIGAVDVRLRLSGTGLASYFGWVWVFWQELVRLVILAEFGLFLHVIGRLVIALELVIRHCGWVMFGWCWFCFLICRYG